MKKRIMKKKKTVIKFKFRKLNKKKLQKKLK